MNFETASPGGFLTDQDGVGLSLIGGTTIFSEAYRAGDFCIAVGRRPRFTQRDR